MAEMETRYYPVSGEVAEEFDHDDAWGDVAEEWTRGLADGRGRHVAIRQAWPELAKALDALMDA